MNIPPWSTTGLFVCLVIQIITFWLIAKKRGKSIREAVLPSALLAGGVLVIFLRELFANVPHWLDVALGIVGSLIILLVLGLWLIRLKGFVSFLKDVWRLEDKTDK